MKTLLNTVVLMSSFNAFAEVNTITTDRKCYNSYESSIKNYITQESQTRKCAIQDAKLIGEVECEQKNGILEEQFVSKIYCETKIYDHMNKRYNRTICYSTVKTFCSTR